ncbi:hypothetical protein [Antrihabitans cavernicola]|uniref:Beta-ketoacyl-[acyl-carrier-protein] synthase III N-terminal domain-containing protein n=1 Tax=Antrihabitans cavernicola TaxID=2495913 RepID=A0A5A7SEI9_9NOCA|nr:hypothetical protein [Spelaeibacter cavernicola]KAA0023053.1 hypothetical protein FOY51_11215 [Spelaeibacter cavernicola]
MPTAIVSYATDTDSYTGSYFEHATRAATACLDAAGVSPDRIGALINVGIYRDSNIVEPAVSALLQKRIGIGLEYSPGRVPSFSFDLMNGACGLLDAISVAESFFAAADVEYVLLTAGDTHPSLTAADDFPYASTGAALLLGRADTAGGFGRVHSASDTRQLEPYGKVVLGEVGIHGRSTITVESPATTVTFAIDAIRSCLDAEGVDLASARLLVPAPTPDFAELLADGLGVASASMITVPRSVGDPHTAAPIFAYANAIEQKAVDRRPLLFVAAGGPVAACVCYRPNGEA